MGHAECNPKNAIQKIFFKKTHKTINNNNLQKQIFFKFLVFW